MRFKSESVQSKISRHVLEKYREKLKQATHLDDGTFHAWVNKIQTAIIFYALYRPSKKHAWRKKHKSMAQLKKFEADNKLYFEIFESTERMYL